MTDKCLIEVVFPLKQTSLNSVYEKRSPRPHLHPSHLAGEANVRLLLGVTAFESVGIEVDPRNQMLKRLPATRQKDLRRRERA